jgi:hypothetical protein
MVDHYVKEIQEWLKYLSSNYRLEWVPGVLYLGVKRPELEADHLPPSSAEFENTLTYTFTPPLCLHGVVLSLKKHRENFYL